MTTAPDAPIKLAVHSISWGIPRGEEFVPWLDEVVEAGYQGIALFAFQLREFIADDDTLRQELDSRGLQLAAVTALVEDAPDWLEAVMGFMRSFGTRHLALADFDPALSIPQAAEVVGERSRLARQYDVNVYYHNHTGGVGETLTELEELTALLDPEPLHLMLDVGHATKDFSELPPSERAATYLERHWPRIEYLELKDWNDTTDLNTPLGEGYADFDRIFRLIGESGYRGGWLVVEQNGTDGLSRGRAPLECARVSREFLTRYGL